MAPLGKTAYKLIRDWAPFRRFKHPTSVVVDEKGAVFVSECATDRIRIQIYKKEMVPEGAFA